jgi:hypothetical protein
MRHMLKAHKESAETKEVFFESELRRVKAEALLALGGKADRAKAAESFRRSSNSRSVERNAATVTHRTWAVPAPT